jgi:hypothetical protein
MPQFATGFLLRDLLGDDPLTVDEAIEEVKFET